MRLLVIDIGNSRIKCALFLDEVIERTFDMASDPTASAAAYRHALHFHVGDSIPHRAAIASVVPALNDPIAQAIQREYMMLPEFVQASDVPEHLVRYEPQESLGADRIAAAVAGHRLYGKGPEGDRAVIVVDAGTAVTFEVVDASGRYLGGAIWAGPELVAHSLSGGTSLLPDVDPVLPRKALGTSTESCLRAGILYGFLDGVSGLLKRLEHVAGASVFTVATGGYGSWLTERIDAIQVCDPTLVLQGIRMMATDDLSQD